LAAPELQRLTDTLRSRQHAMAAANAAERKTRSQQRVSRAPAKRAMYAGAEASRLTADWVFAPLTSAAQEIRFDLRALRARSRDLCRNFSLAKRYLNYSMMNVIGADGIRLHARVAQPDGSLNVELNREIEAAWCDWGQPETASVTGRHSFAEVCRLAYMARARDGEALVRIWRGFDNPYGFALQLLDPDQLDIDFFRAPGDGMNEIRMGVEIDAFEKPVAYWLWSYHPNDFMRGPRERQRVLADEIIHLYRAVRPGQMRGIPDLHAVIIDQKMLAGYIEAELVAARTAAAKMGFFTRARKDGSAPIVDPNTEQSEEPLEMEVEAGLMSSIGDYTFQAWDPQHPVAAFPPFLKAVQRSIAAGLDCNYNGLTGDLEGISYSAYKTGAATEHDFWRVEQATVISQLCRRVYLAWVRIAVAAGQLQAPAADYKRIAAHAWQPRGWDSPDPVKDGQADAQDVALGTNSRTRICAEKGLDYPQVLKELAAEQELAAELGVSITPTAPAAAPGDSNASNDQSGASTPDDAASTDDSQGNRHASRRRLGVVG
jgi:lambda family phage portal protein